MKFKLILLMATLWGVGMTTEQLVWFNYKLSDAKMEPLEELAIGWMRYKALRRLNAEHYKQLIQDSLRG